MHRSINVFSYTLLLFITSAYSMEKPVMTHNTLPNDVIKEFFQYTCADTYTMIGRFRSVCKEWHNIFNPITVQHLLRCDPVAILIELTKNYSADSKKNDPHHIQFFTDMLKNQPHAYDKIIHAIIKKNDLIKLKIALEKIAHTNLLDPFYLSEDFNNMHIFKKLLCTGGDIYQPSENGKTVMDAAFAQASYDDYEMVRIMLEAKGHIHPHNQKRINTFLTDEKLKNIAFLFCLAGMSTLLFYECTLF